MNKRTGLYLYLSSLFLALILVTACTSTVDTQSTPITLPTAPPTQEPRALSSSELMAVDGFVTQEQATGVEWDQLHTDFGRMARDIDVMRRKRLSERPSRVRR